MRVYWLVCFLMKFHICSTNHSILEVTQNFFNGIKRFRIYRCESCGNEIDRDIQASVNLLNLIKKSGVANAVRSPEPRSILADLNKSQLANLVMNA